MTMGNTFIDTDVPSPTSRLAGPESSVEARDISPGTFGEGETTHSSEMLSSMAHFEMMAHASYMNDTFSSRPSGVHVLRTPTSLR
ncbi:hypothetical protein SERLA73DRAFT_135399 [Serpula lacrymans var. lacrymans S7.3]|uniref:Uncharacterized protein n=1 Tax=Serpula lacrymans var. lacrymans (strain S7.3) TaxID=936435 RepID=F8PW35_SERL3|nr:hypothetical protein SERLA73DRAFT_135399 [Serpula lacrymans var. lacrymans S7.3]